MKKRILLCTLAGFFLFATTSCSSDDNKYLTEVDSENIPEKEIPNTLKDEYFDIEGGTFKPGEIPAGEETSILDISVNKFVINGGKTIATLTSNAPLSSVLIGLKGHEGYYDVATANEIQTRSGEFTYEIIIDFSQVLDLTDFELKFVGIITDGKRTEVYYKAFQLVEAGIGELQVSLSWDKEDDVDLHLYDADNNHIYYSNKVVKNVETGETVGELDIDSNPNCNIDGVKNENIYYKNLQDGTYRIYVDLYRKCTNSTGSKYAVNVLHNGTRLHLSDQMIGKFDDDYYGSRNNPSQYVLIGAFSIVNGQFSSVVEVEPLSQQNFSTREVLIREK